MTNHYDVRVVDALMLQQHLNEMAARGYVLHTIMPQSGNPTYLRVVMHHNRPAQNG